MSSGSVGIGVFLDGCKYLLSFLSHLKLRKTDIQMERRRYWMNAKQHRHWGGGGKKAK